MGLDDQCWTLLFPGSLASGNFSWASYLEHCSCIEPFERRIEGGLESEAETPLGGSATYGKK